MYIYVSILRFKQYTTKFYEARNLTSPVSLHDQLRTFRKNWNIMHCCPLDRFYKMLATNVWYWK